MVAIDFLFNDFQFSCLLFLIFFAIAYLISVFLNIKSFKSVIALHATLIFTFTIANILDYFFLIFALIEITILLKLGGSENEF